MFLYLLLSIFNQTNKHTKRLGPQWSCLSLRSQGLWRLWKQSPHERSCTRRPPTGGQEGGIAVGESTAPISSPGLPSPKAAP